MLSHRHLLTERSDVPLPEKYGSWQTRLANGFFALNPGKPVIFFTDDDELRLLAPDSADPAGDLAAAVTQLVNPQAPTMFDAVMAAVREWQAGAQDQPPPTLPVLALSVLAATRMHSDAQARSSNYYLRLAQALLPGADERLIHQVRLTLRDGSFIPVADMWRDLHQWLVQQSGARGVSTIRDHPELTRIGFPLSQALIRRSDRAVLTRFFDALDIRTAGVPAIEPLAEYLRLWAARPRGLSEDFRHALADDTLRGLLMPLISGLAAIWDGQVITTEGLPRTQVAMTLNLERWSARWAIRIGPEAVPDVLRGRVDGAEVEINVTPDRYSSLAQLSGAPPVTGSALRAGFRLRGATQVAEFPATRAMVLAEDPDAGGWLSASAIRPYTEHLIVVSAEFSGEVQRVLQLAADAGWLVIQQPASRPLLPGFAIFRNVVFSEASSLATALRSAPGLLRAVILPDPTARAELINGLPVSRRVGTGLYLTGGEPDLLLPVGDQPRSVATALDGTPQEPAFQATGWPVELRRIGPMPRGDHVIEADRDLLRFTLLDADPATESLPGTDELGWDQNGQLGPGSGKVISGALVSGPDPPAPILVRRSAGRVLLIRRDGTLTTVTEPPPISGPLADVPGLTGYYFELEPPRDAVWLTELGAGRPRIRCLRRVAPEFTALDEFSRRTWPAVAGVGPAGDPLWQLYARAWEHARGR
jgi:hypothetical protein